MKSLAAVTAIVVLLAASTAFGDCGCAAPIAPAPVVVQSYYPASPVYVHPAPVYAVPVARPRTVYYAPAPVYPTRVYYPPAAVYAAPVYYPAAAVVRTRVGPFGGVRTTFRYW